MLPYLLTFCRIVIGLVFAYAFLTKIRDVNAFNQTITRFKLLPAPWSRPMALLFLTGELAVVMLTFVGGQLLPLAFGLAFLQLAIFTMAQASVLARRIQTSCNCFGVNEKPVTYYDIWRNVGFIGCSLLGWRLAPQGMTVLQQPSWFEWVLGGLMAILFVFVWTHLSEVAVLLANHKSKSA